MSARSTARASLNLAVFSGLALLSTAFSATGATSGVVHQPRITEATSSSGWASSNWSGYAITGSGYAAVTGSWNVPSVSATKKQTYSSTWIGIDGFNNSSLIQTGTEQDFAGSAVYRAWWEILPAAETVISSLVVSPGDHMSASIQQTTGTSNWTITLTDDSTGHSFTTVQNYTGPGTSAEWIQEAPSIGGHTATLATYSQVTLDPGTVNGANPGLTPAEAGVMIQARRQVSTPSSPDGDTDGFNVAYGSAVPSPPAS